MQLSRELIGQKIGDYRIDSLLGEGGMGVVFRGVHETLGQLVAIKMLHPALMEDEKIRSRFLREAQALARLNHPNIVRLISFLEREGTYFIVMEYIEGKTIDKVMQLRGLIPPNDAAESFTQVLAAMHYAHSLGIIHRDIKPSNICLLDAGAIVKVLDFGTAKMVGAQRLTQEGMTLGTLIYMSPEQLTGRELDHRSDIYSLGVTLYEMVTGKLPHYDDDEMALVRAIARGVPQPPSAHYKHVPPKLERAIMKAIEKDPAKRFQTADEFLQDLKKFNDEAKMRERKLTPPSGQRAITPDAAIDARPPLDRSKIPLDKTPLVDAPWTTRPGEPAPAPGGGGFKVLAGVSLFAGCAAGAAMLGGAPGLPSGIGPAAAALVAGLGLGAGFFFLGRASAPAATGPATPPVGLPRPGPVGAPGGPGAPAHLEGTIDGAPPPAPRPAAPQGFPVDTLRRDGPGNVVHGGAHTQPPPPPPVAAPPGAPPQSAYIYVIEGADKGRSWPLPQGAITIGRGAHNTIVLNDPGVSTSHAQIGFDGTSYILADLQSRNGCYINSARVQCSPLADKDVIVVGTTQIVIAIPG